MQRLKKQKLEEILADQNAAIDADMVCLFSFLIIRFVFILWSMGEVVFFFCAE